MNKFRTLLPDEIDCRVSTINEKGLTLLLYKDARVDQNILDETVGPMNWSREHVLIDGQLFCRVGIRETDENYVGAFVWKEDVGKESYTEREKGRASDAFKRACFNWGIGRELYTAPLIWIPAGNYTAKEQNGKWTTYDRFSVVEIAYTEGRITYLTIKHDKSGKIVYSWGGRPDADGRITEKKVLALREICKNHSMPESVICARYGKESLEELTWNNWTDFAASGQAFLEKWDEEHQSRH